MPRHLQREIEHLKERLLSLSAVVEERLYMAVQAIVERKVNLALEVIEGDDLIDTMEVELEEDCLKVLALHQPVATDLRFIVAVLKINNDLERIGDLAGNIASRARNLCELEGVTVPIDLFGMTEKVKSMLRRALDSLVKTDTKLAREVCASDNEIDAINREMHIKTRQELPKHPERTDALILLLSVSRNLERIADLATNIAEDVIYMIEGEIVRHKGLRLAQ